MIVESHYYYISDEEYERAAKNGIPKSVLYHRINYYFWDRERALTEPPREKYDDKYEWSKYKEIAKQNGISYATYAKRVQKWGDKLKAATHKILTCEESAGRARLSNRRRIFTNEQIQIAKSNGIPYATLIKRVKQYNWGIKEAISTKPYEKRDIRNKLKGVAQ